MGYNDILNKAMLMCDEMDNFNFKRWRVFNKLYSFTTENISGYIDNFELVNKKLLTVGSSCDQIINAILMGCKDITLVDINPFVKYYYYLKISCIIDLSFDEFMLFLRYYDYPEMFNINERIFDRDLFNKIRVTLKNLDYESYLFWDNIFNRYDNKNIRENLFFSCEYNTKMIKVFNRYLSNINNYNDSKSMVVDASVKFINSNIFNLEIDNSYDNIWLSNIGFYLRDNELKVIVDKMSKLLNIDGLLLICYLYNTDMNTEYRNNLNDVYRLNNTIELLKNYNPQFITFKGVDGVMFNDNKMVDSVLVYKKHL